MHAIPISLYLMMRVRIARRCTWELQVTMSPFVACLRELPYIPTAADTDFEAYALQ